MPRKSGSEASKEEQQRIREALKFWKEHIRICTKLRMSNKEYCENHNLSINSFYYWRKKAREGKKNPYRPVGRPMKYHDLLQSLHPRRVYAPASIADHAIEEGFIEADDTLGRQRIRIAMARFKSSNKFPEEGDDVVYFRGHGTPGWYGWRWRKASKGKK